MTKLVQAVSVVLILFAFAACKQPPQVLNFNTHPSVLRGNWSGTVSDYPDQGMKTALNLTNLTSTCETPDENSQCENYKFRGQLQLGDGSAIEITGDGYAGPGNIYALTSPSPPTRIWLAFSADGRDWVLDAIYYPYNSKYEPNANPSTLAPEPNYQGALRLVGEQNYYYVLLQPKN
jgi:hypothetical protein